MGSPAFLDIRSNTTPRWKWWE